MMLLVLIMALWTPQPGPQAALIESGTPEYFIDEVFYGGARGGGKTDAMLGDFGCHQARYGAAAKGVFFRRQLPQLDDVIERSKQLYAGIGRYNEQKKTWVFKSGAVLRFRSLDRDRDAAKYQGHQYTRVYFEELADFASDRPYLMMIATLRSSAGVPCGIRSTGNPGGVGHNWLKSRFIDAGPPMTPITETIAGMRMRRVYIPSKLTDNPALTDNDPNYEARLHMVGNERLVKAWLSGDWDIIAGGMFDDLWDRSVHVVEPFGIPESWEIRRSFDWGSSKPFSVGWFATSDGTFTSNAPAVPRGTRFRIAELYGWTGKPNEGVQWTDPEIAEAIISKETELGIRERVKPGAADPSIFADGKGTGKSSADVLAEHGATFAKGDNRPGSRKRRAQALRNLLKASLAERMEHPGLFVFNTCVHGFIRTVPVLPRDIKNPEDVDTDAEDHAYDEATYELTRLAIDVPTEGAFVFGN